MPPDASCLRLRPFRTSDEGMFAEAHRQLLDEDFEFGIHYEPGMPWGDYLQAVSDQSLGLNLPESWVRNTRLVADVDGVLVGRTSVRHELNDFLLQYGGHIGYAVVPDQRRRGYATEILRQSIAVAHTIGVERVLVTCDEANIGSVKAIEACGGRLENVVPLPPHNVPRRRYWIT
ncbi:MAG: GNAT family N-acetyltransferase [Actinomycetota bacterium]|nr:GNAT family N-acetyltransferase [Actinomycetota bacterium]